LFSLFSLINGDFASTKKFFFFLIEAYLPRLFLKDVRPLSIRAVFDPSLFPDPCFFSSLFCPAPCSRPDFWPKYFFVLYSHFVFRVNRPSIIALPPPLMPGFPLGRSLSADILSITLSFSSVFPCFFFQEVLKLIKAPS